MVKAFELTNKELPLTAARLAGLQRLPAFWNAKIAVVSNEDRRLFNPLKTLEFARVHKEPVFRWHCPCGRREAPGVWLRPGEAPRVTPILDPSPRRHPTPPHAREGVQAKK